MYLEFYGFGKAPFGGPVEPSELFLAETHREADRDRPAVRQQDCRPAQPWNAYSPAAGAGLRFALLQIVKT